MTGFIEFSQEAAAQGDAFAAYRLSVAAVEAEPENADAWYALGCWLERLKKHHAAVGAFARAAALRPGHHETLTNLGLNLGLVGRLDEALDALNWAITTNPEGAPAWLQLAQVLYVTGSDSVDAARRAVELSPEWPIAHLQLALSLMTRGDWLEGFREYEWRFHYKLTEFLNSYPYPLWRGEETGHLVLASEQGLGDTIMMMRYLPAAIARAERVTWLVQKELFHLARQQAGDIPRLDIRPMPASLPQADAFCPMMSLPVALEIGSAETYSSSYIYPTADVVHGADYLDVGIVWAGSAAHDNAAYRDMPLEALLPLAEIPGVRLSSLQIGPAEIQIAGLGAHALVRDLSGQITEFADTARLIGELDLVISVDTAVAHLAGAMGKPVWMIVNQRARDWRWGRSGETTPWYPSMRIFPRGLDETSWDPVVGWVEAALRELAADQGMPFCIYEATVKSER